MDNLTILFVFLKEELVICDDGKIHGIDMETMEILDELSYGINENGYKYYNQLHCDTKLAHRIIAMKLIDIPDNLKNIPINKLQVNHIDGDKLNNKVENLEWCTPKENVHHAIITGLDHRQNIRDERINKIIYDRQNNRLSINRLSEIYDMSPNSILRILQENDAYEPLNNSNNPIVKQVQDLRREECMTIDQIAEFLNLKRSSVFIYLKEDESYQSMSTAYKHEGNTALFDEIVRLYREEGKSAYAISKMLPVSKPTILKHLQQFSWYDGKSRKLNADGKFDFDKVSELRNNGLTWNQVASEIKCDNVNTLKTWYNKRRQNK